MSAPGAPAILVTVEEVLGSAPRAAGTSMMVWADGISGTIGGGRLEWRAMEVAREALAGVRDLPARLDLPLGPALEQCCGGHVSLRFARLTAEAGARRLAAAEAGRALPHLALFGAGHVGRAVVAALAPLPCRVTWLDGRPGAFPAELPDTVDARPLTDVTEAVARLPPGGYALVMTHAHPLDLDLCDALLRRGDQAWAGLIGSATKRQRFRGQLRARGLAPDAIDRLVCPIGIAGIAGKEPAVIAASVAAQLLMAFEADARRRALPADRDVA